MEWLESGREGGIRCYRCSEEVKHITGWRNQEKLPGEVGI